MIDISRRTHLTPSGYPFHRHRLRIALDKLRTLNLVRTIEGQV